jgi:hypothetical protein
MAGLLITANACLQSLVVCLEFADRPESLESTARTPKLCAWTNRPAAKQRRRNNCEFAGAWIAPTVSAVEHHFTKKNWKAGFVC